MTIGIVRNLEVTDAVVLQMLAEGEGRAAKAAENWACITARSLCLALVGFHGCGAYKIDKRIGILQNPEVVRGLEE